MADNLDLYFQGFSKLNRSQRLERLRHMTDLTDADLDVLEGKQLFDLDLAENFIENVIGYMPVPIGLATYFRIDGRDIPIPMAVEETSIIAAASASAKFVRKHSGSIQTEALGKLIIGQVQFPSIKNIDNACAKITENKSYLLEMANLAVPGLVKRGGGVQDLQIRVLDAVDGNKMLVLHVLCDPCDAMGANLINQVCESLKPYLEDITQEKVGICILSNLVDNKLIKATVVIPNINEEVGQGIQSASEFAESDPYRAATHNKGVLNGIDPILVATGNDWRAVEAGFHAYCARSEKYKPISRWQFDPTINILRGELIAPIAVGTVGGVTRIHPTAQVCLRMMKVKKAEELARIVAAVGLIQNLGALKALSTVGIVKGHMALHAANLAIAAGARANEMGELKEKLLSVFRTENRITLSRAQTILRDLRGITDHRPNA